MAWSTSRKNRARDNAVRIGRFQTRIESSELFLWFAAAACVISFFVIAGLLIGTIEHLI